MILFLLPNNEHLIYSTSFLLERKEAKVQGCTEFAKNGFPTLFHEAVPLCYTRHRTNHTH